MVDGADGEDVIAIRSVCYLPLTYDHRLVDGADAGRFVTAIREAARGGRVRGGPRVAPARPRVDSRARAGARKDRRVRVVVAGSSGLIGTALVAHLRAGGHEVLRLVRRQPAGPDERGWDPPAGRIDAGTFDGVDAVVNLGGVGIADRPWSGARRQALRDSRVVPTDVLAGAVAEHGVPAFLSGSANGYYGDAGGGAVDESAPVGLGLPRRARRTGRRRRSAPATAEYGS